MTVTFVVEELNKALDAHYRDDGQAADAHCILALRAIKPPHFMEVARYIGMQRPAARREQPIRRALAYAKAHKL